MPRKTRKGPSYHDTLMCLAALQFSRQPAFIVQIVSDYNGNGQRLQWAYAPPIAYPNAKFYGRFACFPLEVHDSEALIEKKEEEPTLTVPRRLLEEVREAFLSSAVNVETLEELRQILARTS